MAERRRLPVIQPAKSAEDEEAPRPPWHWVGFGVLAVFTTWLPLAYVTNALASRAVAARVGGASSPGELGRRLAEMSSPERARVVALLVAPSLVAFACAAMAGGFLVGRFGPRGSSGARQGAAAGSIAAAVATAIAAASGGVSWTAVVSIAIGGAFGALGAWLGARRAKRVA